MSSICDAPPWENDQPVNVGKKIEWAPQVVWKLLIQEHFLHLARIETLILLSPSALPKHYTN
jgi:hypothetical protein